jgi:hypothetical protein
MVTERRRKADLQGRWMKWLGIPVAIAAALVAVWQMLGWADAKPAFQRDLRPLWASVESTSKATMLINWQLLEARRQAQGLSPIELAEYCSVGNLLSIRGEGCR